MKKSDWSRAFNQFTIACEHDKCNICSTSAWLLSPLECSPQNKMASLRGRPYKGSQNKRGREKGRPARTLLFSLFFFVHQTNLKMLIGQIR